MDKTTQDRIIADGLKYAKSSGNETIARLAYIAGATAENEHNESVRLQLEAQNANVEILLQQKKALIEKSQVLVDALEECRHALSMCYNVIEHPADGDTQQDRAIVIADKALEQWKGTGKEETKPEPEGCPYCGSATCTSDHK